MSVTNALRRILLVFCLVPAATLAGDAEELAAMLDRFLAHADERAAHERFWAEDLVYTASAGSRTDKARILAGFDDAASAGAAPFTPAYHAEDVDVRLYGDTAVVAFRLVAVSTGEDGTETDQHYFNTGTFLKRDGEWRAIAWQATRIPSSD